MKRSIIFCLIVSIVLLSACKGVKDSNDPKVIVSEFMDALSKKDFTTARQLTTSESQTVINMMETAVKMGSTPESSFVKFDHSRVTLGEATISGETATVPLTENKSGETINYQLQKQNGAWKVAFDLPTLMNIFTDKMVEKGINPVNGALDSLSKGLDQMKSINIDSLSRTMKGGRKALDSITNELKKLKF
jgi:hypothetical protein